MSLVPICTCFLPIFLAIGYFCNNQMCPDVTWEQPVSTGPHLSSLLRSARCVNLEEDGTYTLWGTLDQWEVEIPYINILCFFMSHRQFWDTFYRVPTDTGSQLPSEVTKSMTAWIGSLSFPTSLFLLLFLETSSSKKLGAHGLFTQSLFPGRSQAKTKGLRTWIYKVIRFSNSICIFRTLNFQRYFFPKMDLPENICERVIK